MTEKSAMEVDLGKLRQAMRDMTIPPRPDVITALFEEKAKDEPDLARVAKHISADVGLAAAILRTVNSPFMGLPRKVTSVPQAIDLLGLRNTASIATGLVLRHMVHGDHGAAMERFWDTAENVALISAFLARRLRGIPPDEAYTYGLFHDCGIPLLLQRFPDYKKTLAHANSADGAEFWEVEEAETGTHHSAVGYFLARSWGLAEDLCRAILMHHEPGVFSAAGETEATRNYVGIGLLAEHIHHSTARTAEDVEWEKFRASTLKHFGLEDEDYKSLAEDAQSILAA